MDNKKILIHTYANPLRKDNNVRLLRIVESLKKLGHFDEIHILCGYEKGQNKQEEIFEGVFVKRLTLSFFRKSQIFFKMLNNLLWVIKIVYYSLFRSVSVVNFVGVIDLWTLPFFKIIKKAKVFYYADDIVTENRVGVSQKTIYAITEKLFLKYCNRVIVVSEGIKNWYEEKYCLNNVSIINNAVIGDEEQVRDELYDARKRFNLLEDDIVFGYIGTFTTGRSLELLLKIFSETITNKHLVLAGYGDLKNHVEKMSQIYSNIHYLGSVPWDKIQSFVGSIDVGLVLLEDVSLNYRYALPTKFFEYLASGKPVIVSDFPDMSSIVKKYSCGWCVKPVYSEIYSLIDNIDNKSIRKYKENLTDLRDNFMWEKQEKFLLKIYNDVFT